jgi:hypothetical protein
MASLSFDMEAQLKNVETRLFTVCYECINTIFQINLRFKWVSQWNDHEEQFIKILFMIFQYQNSLYRGTNKKQRLLKCQHVKQ